MGKKVINSTKLHIWESFPAVQRGKNLDAGTPGNVLEEFVFKLNQDRLHKNFDNAL